MDLADRTFMIIRFVPRRSGGWNALVASVILGPALTVACVGRDAARGLVSSSTDGGGAAATDAGAALLRGAQIYANECASCHGVKGEGGGSGASAPSLQNETIGQTALANLIVGAGMPPNNPDKCTNLCASDVAAYIIATFGKSDVSANCGAGTPPAPRALRLLTRREYAATVADLLAAPAATSTAGSEGGCSPPTFTYSATGQSLASVVVTGSFTNWVTTAAAGAWPLTNNNGIWSGSAPVLLSPGQYQYKFVVNGSQWVTDPSNPNQVSDNKGGHNSVLTVTCGSNSDAGAPPVDSGSGGAGVDPTAGFPPEARPTGFLFDDNAPSRNTSSALMAAYWSAATAYAATANLAALVPCDYAADASRCAQAFVTIFGLRAFRRPLVQTEINRYTSLLTGEANGFMAGVSLVVRAMLMSPNFLYRLEIGEAQTDGTYRLTPYETASALSYLLWGTMPDQALFGAATKGMLSTATDIEAQTRRLLAHARARSSIGTFAAQWLGIENIATLSTKAPPWSDAFTPEVRQAMLAETKQFVTHVMFDGSKSYDELLTASYTFANGPLAAIYGLAGVTGSAMQKVSYPDTHRSGLLGHGSILATNSYSDQTSPILRGLFVRQNLLCQTLPSPPADVPPLPAVNPTASTRARVTEHSSNSFCQTCHVAIDPPGFGFESFDPIGAWRTTDNGPIDSSGDMNDLEKLHAGTHAPFTDISQLGKILAASRAAPSCFVNRYYSFAHGHNPPTACSVTGALAHFQSTGHNMQELVVSITTANDFVVRK